MPTPSSVTQTPCCCGFLTRAAKERLTPIKFDEALNEYTFEDEVRHLSLMIYHCPMCGGVASESKRDELFRQVSTKEWIRLNSLTKGLRSVAEIEAALGEADEAATEKPTRQEAALFRKMASSRRRLTFSRLSQSADVHFWLYSNGKLECTIMPKLKRGRTPRQP